MRAAVEPFALSLSKRALRTTPFTTPHPFALSLSKRSAVSGLLDRSGARCRDRPGLAPAGE